MKKRIFMSVIVVMLTITAYTTYARADYYSGYVTLKKGMQGSEVKNLQNDMRRLGYFSSGSTGYFGDLTKQSVVKYQKDNYLVADGIVGHGTAREIKVDKILQQAKQYQGVPYVWGGTSPSGFDCSGFIHYTLLKNGIIVPRTAALQFNEGTWVSKDNLRPGDLVFFSTYKAGASHVGFYLGNGKFIHASSGAEKVTISELNKDYYVKHYIGAKRVIY
jgi:cell wall-associated NlpC family hydrolase